MSNVAEEKLRQLQEELSKAQADRVTRQSKYELASTAPPDSLPEVLDDATLKEYQVKLTDLRRQLAELSSTLTPAHPSVKKVQAQVTTLEAALEKERANVIRRIQNEFESAQRREKLLAASYAAQARLVTEQAAKVTHYNILKREVDNNRQLYDSMLRTSRRPASPPPCAPATCGWSIRPDRPTRPYKPNLVLNSVLGLFAGGFFGMVFVVMRERADRSIQAPGEAALYLDVPELGVIPSADAERSRSFAYYRQGRGAEAKELKEIERSGQVELVTWRETFGACRLLPLHPGLHSVLRGERRPAARDRADQRQPRGRQDDGGQQPGAGAGRDRPARPPDRRRSAQAAPARNLQGVQRMGAERPSRGARSCPKAARRMVIGTGYRTCICCLPAQRASSISSLLHSPRALEFLQRMRQEFDMVIIDTPPMLQMPDARVLGTAGGWRNSGGAFGPRPRGRSGGRRPAAGGRRNAGAGNGAERMGSAEDAPCRRIRIRIRIPVLSLP